MEKKEALQKWRERLEKAREAHQPELDKMDHREALYAGRHTIKSFVINGKDPWEGKAPAYCYNALAETIEAQISSEIPMPKVTPRREQDEHLAVIIENMIRNELDRLPMEMINDQAERTVPIQGGGLYLLEWDNRKRSHNSVGENTVSFIHPKWFIPQEGVFTSVEDMDWFFLMIPQTKAGIRAAYGVEVYDEAESEPDIRSTEGETPAEELVTMYVAYYRNENGGIGKFSWVNEVVLEDLEDYQARRLNRCKNCGAPEPGEGTEYMAADGTLEEWTSGSPCPVCGGTVWERAEEEYEEIELTDEVDGLTGEPRKVKVPWYKPDVYPCVLQRNVSIFGRLLGDSDVDKIESLQDGLNRLEAQIFDRLLMAGTYITLPPDPTIKIDVGVAHVIRLKNPADKSQIGSYDFAGNVEQELAQVHYIYQQMRQAIGVTDSFQGRTDRTATSGKAKEFSAAQAAGRMESKRRMKEAAYADLFKLMFQFRLAYADEPRPVVYQDGHGKTVYDTFNRMDFLEVDEAGDYWWNDQFLFSCDTSAPLASNRERLWQETTSFLQAGAFGDPTQPETLVEYWRKMELLHYPGAGETRKNMQERLEQAQMQVAPLPENVPQGAGMAPEDIEAMARQAAMEAATSEAAGAAAMRDLGM